MGQGKVVILSHIMGVINPADALIKALGRVLHKRHGGWWEWSGQEIMNNNSELNLGEGVRILTTTSGGKRVASLYCLFCFLMDLILGNLRHQSTKQISGSLHHQ